MAVLIVSLLSLLLLSVYAALIGWYQRAWMASPSFTPDASSVRLSADPFIAADQEADWPRISVLVPARNEEVHIGPCLDALLRQTYSSHLFEIIVIDDHSTDATAAIVGRYLERIDIPAIKLIRLADHPMPQQDGVAARAYKKYAIETGIRSASGTLIVTTDADCLSGPDWLRTIAAFRQEKDARFIAAPVRIGQPFPTQGQRPSQTFLSIFQTLDFITLQGITGASVYKRSHSMCNGANLAYDRDAFFAVDGFRGIDSIPSGDDMLLMHKIYLRYPGHVFFCKSEDAIVSTAPETRWRGFVNQRVRWASKADSYDDKRIFRVLMFVYLFNLFYIGLAAAVFWNGWFLGLLLLLLILKTMVEYPFVRSVARFFGQQGLMVYFPVMQPFHILYTVVIGWLGKFGSYRWKERKIVK